VSLRILFADDSMTAQNMGKKILSEAGYDVVAVSNGAAAVKKIAEQKPDIIILDVYMPGYSGLEVCEKVRGSLDTLKTPVLLTVGKMEPYKPEDANRVKADGVIIKPFEASDLLAIVKKFEERIGQIPVPPMVEQTVRLERQYQEDAIEEAHMQQHHSTGKTGIQPMVEVPDHMAGSAAFTDMLGSDSSSAPQHFAVNTPAAAFETSVIVPAPPVPSAEYDLPVSWNEEPQAEPVSVTPEQLSPELVATPVEASAEPISSPTMPEAEATTLTVEASEPEISHPQFIPVFKEPEPEPAAYEVVHTAAAPTGEMEIPREPALQETAEETTRSTVADHVEPGLMTTLSQEVDPQTFASAGSGPEAKPELEIAPANHYSTPLPAVEATAEVTDADFEARVAAAMAAYGHATEAAPAHESENEGAAVTSAEAAATDTVYTVHAVAVPEPTPSFEYHPPVRTPEAAPAAPAVVAAADSVAQPAPAVSEPVAPQPEAFHSVVTAGLEVAAVAAAAETGAEHHTIAQAVHRVMERLKPELVEEIMRELRSKK
jgi:CheY-like chemotaxis protein